MKTIILVALFLIIYVLGVKSSIRIYETTISTKAERRRGNITNFVWALMWPINIFIKRG